MFLLPATPNSILAEEVLRVCKEELRESDLSITVQERGGGSLEVCWASPSRGRVTGYLATETPVFPATLAVKVSAERQALDMKFSV